jgi:alpha-1,6-mannosyltransferase
MESLIIRGILDGERRRPVAVLVLLGGLSGSLYVAAVPLAIRLGFAPMAFHLVVFAVLFALYLGGVWVVRRAAPSPALLGVVLAFGLVFRLAVVPTPVYLSSDSYRYIWDGRVQLAGINPYRYPPAAPELLALRDDTIHPHINRPDARTVYPPAAQWLFALAAVALPPTIAAWRILLVACDALTVALLLRVLRRLGAPAPWVVTYVWSPLVVFEGIQGAHLELAVLPVILGALTWRQAGSSVQAGIALGIATLMRLYPALFVLAWWRRGDWRFPAAVAVTVALGYLPYALSVGAGALGFLPEYLGRAEDHNIGLRALVEWGLGLRGEVARGLLLTAFFAALLAVLGWIGRAAGGGDPARLWNASALAAGAYLLLVPTSMHAWYVLLIVPFLCVSPSAAWLYFSGAVTISYVEYLVHPAPYPPWVWALQYFPLYGLLLAGWRREAGAWLPARLSPRTS